MLCAVCRKYCCIHLFVFLLLFYCLLLFFFFKQKTAYEMRISDWSSDVCSSDLLCCGGDPARLNAMRVRFTSPVFPGDVIRTEVWEEGNVLRFRSSVPARGEVVVDCGTAERDNFAAA